MITVDFESEAIDGNPLLNPPRPVGVAIKYDDQPSRYYAWGHPTENNCTLEQGQSALFEVYLCYINDEDLLFHNAPFDISIWSKYIGAFDWRPLQIHDTQYDLFLTDPYAFTFSLKPSAERVLNWPAEERDALTDWILAHVAGATRKTAGAYIAKAPGGLVGKYACGDVDRTYAIYQKLHPKVLQDQMLAAYRREQKLAPILTASSVRGIRVDRERLGSDVETVYNPALAAVEGMIWKKLGREIDLDKDNELADAIEASGLEVNWVFTPTGKRSTSRANLQKAIGDRELLALLSYRGALATCVRTFALPWYRLSESTGRVHTQWNQVRGDRSSRDIAGTRTGRLSAMEPNFQNVPNDFENIVVPSGLPALPQLRKYLLAEFGEVWLKRDFSSQEMRIMAHFAEGKLYEAYREKPDTDPHDLVKGIIKELLGIDMPRKYVKITGFGIMYGRGVPNLSEALGVDQQEGKEVRDAYFTALPEVRTLSNKCRNRGRSGNPIRTWGGRLYYREPNPDRDLSYKLLNYLIQGSAADQTKQSIIDWEASRNSTDTFLATVHDEICISAPPEDAVGAMSRLRLAMDAPRFDVPFMSEGYRGPNWSELEECE
jgi:DNA polymerase I-like protein with 3'-5' exonuclease and polymerase domains